MSLRARLLIGLIVVTAAGLVIAGVVTYEAERSFLVSRVDAQFNQAAINGFEDYVDARLHLHKGPAADENDARFPGGPPGLHGGPGGTLTTSERHDRDLRRGERHAERARRIRRHRRVLPEGHVAAIPISSVAGPRLITVDSRPGRRCSTA